MVELMVVVVILAVLLAIGIPSFSSMINNAQVRTAGQSLNDGLELARTEAIRRNQRVLFTLGAGSGWTVSLESGGTVIQSRLAGDGSPLATVTVTPATATVLTYSGQGRVAANTDGSASITMLVIGLPAGTVPTSSAIQRNISISSGGSFRLCDPNGTTGVGMGC
jgi:type IV fimbrial biogenesis protein FimT